MHISPLRRNFLRFKTFETTIRVKLYSQHNNKNETKEVEPDIIFRSYDKKSADKSTKPHISIDSLSSDEKKIDYKVSSFFTLVDSAKQFFGLDDKSIEKRRRAKAINSTIDNALQGTGLIGAAIGSIAKVVARKLSDSITETQDHICEVQYATQNCLSKDFRVVSLLGENITCGNPHRTAINSIENNGIATTKVILSMNVKGDKGAGQVHVNATLEPHNEYVYLSTILFTPSYGLQFNVTGGNILKRKIVII